jgi:outer membrane biosynthesis protein TonB
MDTANYHTFTLQIPIGIHVVTPMATSSSLLDQFSLLIATSLGALQQEAQRKEIERAMTTEPLSLIQHYELDLALRRMAYETAQKIAVDFVPTLMAKLKLELPALPVPEEVKPAPNSEPEPEQSPKEEPEQKTEQKPEPEEAKEPEPEPTPEVLPPKEQPPAAYQVGQQVENPVIAAVLKDISTCSNGFKFTKEAGGFRCEGKGHFVSDADVEAEYQKRV